MVIGSLSMWTLDSSSPSELLRTITDRRRVKVDADVLSFHGHLLSSCGCCFGEPEFFNTRPSRREEVPPLLAIAGLRCDPA